MSKKAEAESVREALASNPPRRKPIADSDWLSLGTTLMNLAVSGRADGGIAKGMYAWFCGSSGSAKTWWLFQVLAEAARNPQFKDYRFIFDNSENGAYMDVATFFGDKVVARLEPPGGTKRKPVNSELAEEFYYNMDDAIKDGRPFIYCLDSMDALRAGVDDEKFEEKKAAHRNGKEVTGTYGMAKAKTNSDNIKRVVSGMARTGSILLVVSQTRANVGAGFNPDVVSGGRALRFFAHVQMWTKNVGILKETARGKDREVGKKVQIDVDKNRVSGWEGKIQMPFIRRFGFDETGGCVDFLVEEGYWKKAGGVVTAKEFKFAGRRGDLIRQIEETDGGPEKLSSLVQFVWREIDAEATEKVKRRRRYE